MNKAETNEQTKMFPKALLTHLVASLISSFVISFIPNLVGDGTFLFGAHIGTAVGLGFLYLSVRSQKYLKEDQLSYF